DMHSIASKQPSSGVTLRRLGHRDLPAIERHLLDLDLISRNRRFHSGFGDTAVAMYVRSLDLTAGVVFGACEPASVRAVGLGEAHPSGEPQTVEVGVSVLDRHRGRDIGRRLVEHAIAAAFAQGATTAEMLFDPADLAVTRIVAGVGARTCAPGHAVVRSDGYP